MLLSFPSWFALNELLQVFSFTILAMCMLYLTFGGPAQTPGKLHPPAHQKNRFHEEVRNIYWPGFTMLFDDVFL